MKTREVIPACGLLKVGDTIQSEYGVARVKRIELTVGDDCKSGVPVESVRWNVAQIPGVVVVDLSNGHWAFGYTIRPVGGEEVML